MIQLIITRKCNFLCKHCMYSCDKNGGHMPSDVFNGALEYVKHAGEVDVMGGEPTLHPFFADWLKALALLASGMRLTTNGSWVYTPESKGILKTLELVSSMLSEKLFVRLSADKWHREFINKEALGAAAMQLREKGIRVFEAEDDTPYPLGRSLEGEACEYAKKSGVFNTPAECTKGEYCVWNNLSIDIDGSVAPCPHHHSLIGNILREPLEEVIKRAGDFISAIREGKPKNEDCAHCALLFAEMGVINNGTA